MIFFYINWINQESGIIRKTLILTVAVLRLILYSLESSQWNDIILIS